MHYHTCNEETDIFGSTIILEKDKQLPAQYADPHSSDYIQTACAIYESLINNYLAIADELARRKGLPLLFPRHQELDP